MIKTVVDKFLVQLQSQLDEKKVFLDVDEDARLWLAEHGYDAKMGARPMDRSDSGEDQEASGGGGAIWLPGG